LNIFEIFEKSSISNFMKICPVGAASFHAYGQTEGRPDGQT